MARFDVYRGFDGAAYLLDCQADLLSELQTRFVVPLMPLADAPPAIRRLNPVFEIDGQSCVMVTQLAAAIPRRECRTVVASLAGERDAIIAALDMLITGF